MAAANAFLETLELERTTYLYHYWQLFPATVYKRDRSQRIISFHQVQTCRCVPTTRLYFTSRQVWTISIVKVCRVAKYTSCGRTIKTTRLIFVKSIQSTNILPHKASHRNNVMIFTCFLQNTGGRDSSVGIATRYGLDGRGIESRWGARFSAPVQTGPGAHPASCTMGTGVFPGVKAAGASCWPPTPSSVPKS